MYSYYIDFIMEFDSVSGVTGHESYRVNVISWYF